MTARRVLAPGGPVQAVVPLESQMQAALEVIHPVIGLSITQAREELDEVIDHAKSFFQLQPDETMRLVLGYSARLSEVRVRVYRVEDRSPLWKLFRTRELETVIDELKRQYDGASRLESVRSLDWQIETGKGAT